MRRPYTLAMVLLGIMGCSEAPAAPRATLPDTATARSAQVATPAVCEKNWLYTRDGSWQDPSNWLPSGVPTRNDEVCITGTGSYVITVDATTEADSVYVGPGVTVTLQGVAWSTDIYVAEELVVAPGATATLASISLQGDDIINDGSLRLDDSYLRLAVDLENRGLLEFEGYAYAHTDHFVHEGDLNVLSMSAIDCTLCELRTGRILGPGTLFIRGSWTGVNQLIWSGTALSTRNATTNEAQVVVEGLDVQLANTSLAGAIDMGGGHALLGDIGAGVDVMLTPDGWGTASHALRPLSSAPAGTPVNVTGTLWLRGIDMVAPGLVVNRNRLKVTSPSSWSGATLENRGQLDVLADFRTDGSIRNHATVAVATGARWSVNGGTFSALAGSGQSGRLQVVGGRLEGEGALGDAQVLAGGIAPGPGYATLTFDRLTLGAAATVQLDAAGLLTFDRLRVKGEATYAGQLDVVAAGGFASVSGSCGQVLPMITDRNSLTQHAPGRFSNYGNLPGGTGRAWRAHYPRDSVLVTGYDPTVSISTTLAGSLAEGGPAATGQVCLGVPPTSADISATLTAQNGQFTATPSTLLFARNDFALPRAVRYAAVDDTKSQGPHADNLLFALTSGGTPVGAAPPVPVFTIADNDPAVDLTVSMVSANTAVATGQVMERRFRVTNLGPGASTGSTLSMSALSGLVYGSSLGVSCTLASGALSCPIGALASGAYVEFVLLFTAPAAAGTYTNTLRIQGRDWDNLGTNNTLAWVLTVN